MKLKKVLGGDFLAIFQTYSTAQNPANLVNLLGEALMENFTFCAVSIHHLYHPHILSEAHIEPF